jgi:LmbE family N-acetylglucosaminyl deacetylase
MRIVGIGAHPDDIEIYFSGFLALAQGNGHEVEWIIATCGGAAGTGDLVTLPQRRWQEACAAAGVFGITPIGLDRVDGELSSDTGLGDLIEKELRRVEPELVVTHAPNDYHPDHRALSAHVVVAASYRVPVLYADTMLGINSHPSLYVDISEHMEKKKRAISLHTSQPTERFLEVVEIWNRFRGLQSGSSACRYAEGFRFEPGFPFGTIHSLVLKATPHLL